LGSYDSLPEPTRPVEDRDARCRCSWPTGAEAKEAEARQAKTWASVSGAKAERAAVEIVMTWV